MTDLLITDEEIKKWKQQEADFEVKLQLGYVPDDIRVELHIFVGGVTFLDGTLNKTLTAADFRR